MKVLGRIAGLTYLVAAGLAGPAVAQDNLDQGKSPSQLFTQDCAVCHKTPQGLATKLGSSDLAEFLREHYTASKESAAAIATYLRQAGNAPTTAPKPTKRKPDDKTKTGDKTTDKPADQAADKKDEKTGDKPSDEKPAVKPADKPKSAKTDTGTKLSGPKSAAPKKPDDSDKSD